MILWREMRYTYHYKINNILKYAYYIFNQPNIQMILHSQPSVFTKISLKSFCFMPWIHFSFFHISILLICIFASICLYLHSFHLPVPSLNDSNLTMQLEDLDWKFDIVSNQYFRFFIWFGNQIHVMRIPKLIPHPLTLKATERQRA